MVWEASISRPQAQGLTWQQGFGDTGPVGITLTPTSVVTACLGEGTVNVLH